MSWQTYVDEHLLCDIDGQRLTAAAIVGHDGSVWAQSDTFPPVSFLSLLLLASLDSPAGRFNIHLNTHTASIALFLSTVQYKPEEIAAIMKDFDEPGSLAPTGLYLGGTKYMVIQGEPGAVIRGKKVRILHPIYGLD
ncbi:hypothetical protein BHE74_00024752 [Ensete ventricosum]|nr:hypothetical protein BHE74_00024752 [Ensete ventricosum]